MTRGEVMTRMSMEEFYHWMLLERVEPFGETAEYIRAGRLAALIANIHRDAKKHEAFTLRDWAPELFIDEQQREQGGMPQWVSYFAGLMEYQKNKGKLIQGAPLETHQ